MVTNTVRIDCPIGRLIGKPVKDVEKWLKAQGLNISNKSEVTVCDQNYIKWKDFGFVGCVKNGVVDCIWLHLVPKEGKKPFLLPFCEKVSKKDSMEYVEQILGKPLIKSKRTDLDRIFRGIPFPIYPFLCYQGNQYFVHFEFTEEGKSISTVTFQGGDPTPKGSRISPFTSEADLEITSGESFRLKKGETAKLKNVDFRIRNEGVGKVIYREPFGEYYYVDLHLKLKSEEEVVELSMSTTVGVRKGDHLRSRV